jgi:hypothetical protein
MKYLEIILKLLFAAGAVCYFVSPTRFFQSIWMFILVSLLLGILLIFNKQHSYYWYKPSKRELKIRQIEGGLLVLFAVSFAILKAQGLI